MELMLSVKGTAVELSAVLASLAPLSTSTTTSQEEPEGLEPSASVEKKPKRARRTKVEMEAVRAVQEDPEAQPEEKPEAATGKKPSVEDVRALLIELGRRTGGTSERARAIVKQVTGKDKFGDVTAEELPALVEAVEAELNALPKAA